MALHDFRILIEDLHDRSGRPLVAVVELVAVNAKDRFPKPVEVTFIRDDTGEDLRVALDEGEAGALFDALSGALHTLAATSDGRAGA